MATTTIAVTKDFAGSLVTPYTTPVPRSLRVAQVLRNLKESELESLASLGWPHRVSRGQIVYCEGESLKCLYFIESGSVKLIRNSVEGKELIVSLVGAGDCFGTWTPARSASTFAQALEDSRLFLVPVQAIRRLASTNPAFALDMIQICEDKSLAAQTVAARLAFDTVPQRLAHLLLGLSDLRYGTLRFPLNQTEIANLIGSSRETVCSVLSRLRRQGLLSIVKGRIRVLERERLSAVR